MKLVGLSNSHVVTFQTALKVTSGSQLHQIASLLRIRDLHQLEKDLKDRNKEFLQLRHEATLLSLSSQLSTPYTSFVGIEKKSTPSLHSMEMEQYVLREANKDNSTQAKIMASEIVKTRNIIMNTRREKVAFANIIINYKINQTTNPQSFLQKLAHVCYYCNVTSIGNGSPPEEISIF